MALLIQTPTEDYLRHLTDDEYEEYIDLISDYLSKNKINCDCDFDSLFCVKESMNCKYYAQPLRDLLKQYNYQLPEGDDDFQFIFNFLSNQFDSYNNAIKAYGSFIDDDNNFCKIYDQYMESETTYKLYFTENLLKMCMRLWLKDIVKVNILNYDTFCVLMGQCNFTDTSPREALLGFTKDIIIKILFHNFI